VIKSLVEAATAASLRRRYSCGKVTRQVTVLRRFVPERMFDKSIRKQMRLPGVIRLVRPTLTARSLLTRQ
jgi:hypothetical protein